MNREDLLEAIGAADEEMLEKSEKRTKRNWLVAAVAACLCCVMILSIFLMFPTQTHRVILENISWTPDHFIGNPERDDTHGAQILREDWIDYQFTQTMSIEARVISVLPDTYVMLGSTGQAYHVLHLQVLDALVGKGFPKTIYYLLPSYYDPDLTEYDSLIISLAQCGAEDFLLINVDKQQVESFDYVFHRVKYAAYYGAFMAFKWGRLDTSLWDKQGWNARKSLMAYMVSADSDPSVIYPGKIGRSLSQTKKIIRESANVSSYSMQEVISLDTLREYENGMEFLQQVELTENDIFKHSVSRFTSGGVGYGRYIHGFITNDTVWFDYRTRKAYREEGSVAFTERDMQNLPDLPWALEHLKEILAEQCPEIDTQKVNVIFKRYCKRGDAVYGEIVFTLPKEEDNRYVIISQDGTIAVMTKKEYDALMGK